MPKIIEGVRENVLETAKTILFSEGYQGLSMRSVAAASGIATGTIYNYFESKDVLIANIMMKDWHIALEKMQEAVAQATCVWKGLEGMHQAIVDFAAIYEVIWNQSANTGQFSLTLDRHRLLCQQIGGMVDILLRNQGYENKLDFAEFLAENILASATRTCFLPQMKEMVETMFPS